MTYWIRMWKKYADFSGRDTRAEYWYAFLVNVIISMLVGVVGLVFPVLSGLYMLVAFIPGCALFTRRMHDTGKGGGLLFVIFIPFVLFYVFTLLGRFSLSLLLIALDGICGVLFIIMGIYAIVQLAKQGMHGANQYGADPRGNAPAVHATLNSCCPACGFEYSSPALFCEFCGAKIN